jgi:hypothetical protein
VLNICGCKTHHPVDTGILTTALYGEKNSPPYPVDIDTTAVAIHFSQTPQFGFVAIRFCGFKMENQIT